MKSTKQPVILDKESRDWIKNRVKNTFPNADAMIATFEKLLAIPSYIPNRYIGTADKVLTCARLYKDTIEYESSRHYYTALIDLNSQIEIFLKHLYGLIDPFSLQCNDTPKHPDGTYKKEWSDEDLYKYALKLIDDPETSLSSEDEYNKELKEKKKSPEERYYWWVYLYRNGGVHLPPKLKKDSYRTQIDTYTFRTLAGFLCIANKYKTVINEKYQWYVTEKSFEEKSFDVKYYCQKIQKEYEEYEEKVGTYVNLVWKGSDMLNRTIKLKMLTPKEVIHPDIRQFMLEGNAGTGKTFLLKKLTCNFADGTLNFLQQKTAMGNELRDLDGNAIGSAAKRKGNPLNNMNRQERHAFAEEKKKKYAVCLKKPPYLPVFIELKNLEETKSPVTDAFCQALGVNASRSDLLLRNGRFILMLDGYDEIRKSAIKTAVKEQIEQLKKYPHLILIVSNRLENKNTAPDIAFRLRVSYTVEDYKALINKNANAKIRPILLNELQNNNRYFNNCTPLKLTHIIEGTTVKDGVPKFPEYTHCMKILERECREKNNDLTDQAEYCMFALAMLKNNANYLSKLQLLFAEILPACGYSGTYAPDCVRLLKELGIMVLAEAGLDDKTSTYSLYSEDLKTEMRNYGTVNLVNEEFSKIIAKYNN